MCNEINLPSLYIDCGEILEKQKQYSEAVTLYIKAEEYEKAGHVYVDYLIKNDPTCIPEASRVMSKVKSGHLNSLFAKACVSVKRYDEAVLAYQRAKDYDKVVELKLKYLDEIQDAFDLIRISSSAYGALLIAEYCQMNHDYNGAIEFLLIAGKSDDAFKLAQIHNKMDAYTDILGDHISTEDAQKVAQYYEKQRDYGKAGKYYTYCAQYPLALKLYLQCGDREIDSAIHVVGISQNDTLTHELIDFLIGDRDGVPKDPNYIYRLYMALKKYEEASKTAMLIAKQEQDAGNYSLAHAVIAETINQLELSKINVPMHLRSTFVLLHSYDRVKSLVKRGDHMSAARMLLRIAQDVSKFPQHKIKILCSTIIECHRAGLNVSAYEYASALMRPESRDKIPATLKRKIEGIARRKPDPSDEAHHELSVCPVSGQLIPVTELECPTTRDALPMCVVTGKHIVLDDTCFCPNSNFPALKSEYMKYIRAELAESPLNNDEEANVEDPPGEKIAVDPVFGKPVTEADIKLATPEEVAQYIKKYNNVKEDSAKDNSSKKPESYSSDMKEIKVSPSADEK